MKCWQEIKVKLWNWNADCRLQMHNKDWKVWTSFCICWMDFILVRQMDLQVRTFEDGRLVVVEVVLQCSPLCINPRPPSSSWSSRLLGEVPSHHSRAPHYYQHISVLSRHPPREQSPTLTGGGLHCRSSSWHSHGCQIQGRRGPHISHKLCGQGALPAEAALSLPSYSWFETRALLLAALMPSGGRIPWDNACDQNQCWSQGSSSWSASF